MSVVRLLKTRTRLCVEMVHGGTEGIHIIYYMYACSINFGEERKRKKNYRTKVQMILRVTNTEKGPYIRSQRI